MVPSLVTAAPLAGGSSACIRAAMLPQFSPYLTTKADSRHGAVGVQVDAVEIIAKKLGWWGLLPNNTWDGAIGQLIRH
ncbi:Ionotropic receptor 160, partial [Hyalella azteca]